MSLSLNPYNCNSDLIGKFLQEVQSHTSLKLLKFFKQFEPLKKAESIRSKESLGQATILTPQ
jgi:hypothetical protein